MKPKLTKAQLAKARRAVALEVGWLLERDDHAGSYGNNLVFSGDPEWPEVERLLRVALRAVRGA